MIVKSTVYNQVFFEKLLSGFLRGFCKIMQDYSNITFEVMFYIDGNSNNLRKYKKTFFFRVSKP